MNVALDEAFEMEIIEEEKLNDAVYIRMSRITDVHLADAERIVFDVSEVSVLPSGRIDFKNQEVIRSFVRSLP